MSNVLHNLYPRDTPSDLHTGLVVLRGCTSNGGYNVITTADFSTECRAIPSIERQPCCSATTYNYTSGEKNQLSAAVVVYQEPNVNLFNNVTHLERSVKTGVARFPNLPLEPVLHFGPGLRLSGYTSVPLRSSTSQFGAINACKRHAPIV